MLVNELKRRRDDVFQDDEDAEGSVFEVDALRRELCASPLVGKGRIKKRAKLESRVTSNGTDDSRQESSGAMELVEFENDGDMGEDGWSRRMCVEEQPPMFGHLLIRTLQGKVVRLDFEQSDGNSIRVRDIVKRLHEEHGFPAKSFGLIRKKICLGMDRDPEVRVSSGELLHMIASVGGRC